MTRDMDELFLCSAFRQEPEACHTALMRAARSVKEDETMKRASLRIVLITILVVAAMTAAAFALGNSGLMEWFQTLYGAEIPQAAQDVLAATEPKTFTVGPISFTIKETLADGRIAYLTVEARTADGSAAVLSMGNADPFDLVGEAVAAALDTDGITARTTFADAARIADLPLYSVTAWLDPVGDVMAGEEMMDTVFQEDGSILLIDMLYTDPAAVGAALTADITMRAVELDLETLEHKENAEWKAAETRSIPVHGVVAERSYAVSSTEKLGGYLTVMEVTAEQTCAGIYLTVHAAVAEGGTLNAIRSGDSLQVLDENGKRFPTGISMTSEYLSGDGGAFPGDGSAASLSTSGLQYRMMITVDAFPDSLIVTDGATEIHAELE